MREVLRRIAIHGGLTAVILAIVGSMLAELASQWMAASTPPRAKLASGPPDTSLIRTRVPAMMAFWGFAIVAAGELLLFRIRKNRTPPAAAIEPMRAEAALQQLLAEADARARAATVAPNVTTPPPLHLSHATVEFETPTSAATPMA